MVKKETDHFLRNDELGWSVWKSKYAQPNEDTPDDMHRRLAKEFARIEEKYYNEGEQWKDKTNLSDYGSTRSHLQEEDIFQLFKDFRYIVPQGSIMYGLGRTDKYISLSNCFVIPSATDSYSGIFKTEQEQIQLMKRRGGVGHDISNLRPKGTNVSNSAGTSTGAVSFMERFSNGTREVAQGGRRGALMQSIDIRHPDVEEFITIKSDHTKVTGANISVKLNKEFIQAVKDDSDYILRWPCNAQVASTDVYDLFEYNKLIESKNEHSEYRSFKKIRAKELWNTLTEQAKNNAEPGLMFWDNILDGSPDSVYEQYVPICSNPCGEQFLQAYDSCRLFALNLYSFVVDPFTDHAILDTQKLYEVAYEQQRLADDLIDLEVECVDKIINKIEGEKNEQDLIELNLWKNVREAAIKGRRTGCGITALADTLAALNIKYDSEEGIKMTEEIMKTKMMAELDCSIDLSILRGSFDGWDPNKEFDIIPDNAIESGKNSFYEVIRQEFPEQVGKMSVYARRNVSFSTVAPTGSVSILTQTSSGCEPLFMPYYMRRKKINSDNKESRIDYTDQNGDNWQEYPVLHAKFNDWYKSIDGWRTIEGDQLPLEKCSPSDIAEAFRNSPWYGSTANDIDWRKRLEIQAVLQKYTTNAISSTLNLPSDVSIETVRSIYMEAYDLGLKGVTIYVEGSRSGVLVDTSKKDTPVFEQHDAPKRPEILPVDIHTTIASGTKWNIIVGLFDSKPYEVFAIPYFTKEEHLEVKKIDSGRYDLLKNGETYSENITSSMNDEQEMITRLLSTSLRHGTNITFLVEQLSKTSGGITSFGKAITRVLKTYANTERLIAKQQCTECGSTNMVYEEGCKHCLDCGNSAC